ncbi:MAG: hypothetical protein AB7P69_07220 [Candidatus Binatia bacterium]
MKGITVLMSTNDLTPLPLLIPLSWWRRLQQVSQACAMSPGEFVKEIIEAEIVRRELLMEHENDSTLSWLGNVNTPSTAQLQ